MKGYVFDIDHFAVHDGPGIRTTIYLKGCPLRCLWCHSPESQKKEPEVLFAQKALSLCGSEMTAQEVISEGIQDQVFYRNSGGGVTLTGGEVLYQPFFAMEILKGLKEHRIHTIVETSGFGDWNHLEEISKYTDIFYYDVKVIDDELHKQYTGASNQVILRNLTQLSSFHDEIVIRIPLIPGYTDTIENVTAIYHLAAELKIRQIHLLPYNPSAPAKYEWVDRTYKLGTLPTQDNEYPETLLNKKLPGQMVEIIR